MVFEKIRVEHLGVCPNNIDVEDELVDVVGPTMSGLCGTFDTPYNTTSTRTIEFIILGCKLQNVYFLCTRMQWAKYACNTFWRTENWFYTRGACLYKY